MALFCCDNRQDCVGLALVVGVVLGVVAALLRITAVITLPPVWWHGAAARTGTNKKARTIVRAIHYFLCISLSITYP